MTMIIEQTLKEEAGRIEFSSSLPLLDEGFLWAKAQALAYAHFGDDPVGLWYEAALPSRNAFCMRDVAHQTIGAAALGLQAHNRNMLYKFAEHISDAKDWCSFWEIDKEDRPAPVDYSDDGDFWYNLPANFDLLDACYRQYLWTGDKAYISDAIFENFYLRTVRDYVARWDKDGDGILEHYKEYGRRGLASYNEDGLHPLVGGDLVGAMYAGYRAFAELVSLKGEAGLAEEFERKAEELQRRYQSVWWNEKARRFYGAFLQDFSFYPSYYSEGNFLPLYYGIIRDNEKLHMTMQDLMLNGVPNVEAKTYLPDIYYRYGLYDYALRELLELTDPGLKRREYPEVSFTVVGAIVSGLMGIQGDGDRTVSTISRLSDTLEWAKVREVPVMGRMVSVEHRGREETRFTNNGVTSVYWKAGFASDANTLLCDGHREAAQLEMDVMGNVSSYVTIEVMPGATSCVRLLQ